MADSQDPAVQGRRLRSELRRARQAAGLTQKDVADALDWSASKLIRIERGSVGISTTDLKALLQNYGVDDPARIASLVEMARISKRPAWWTKYKHMFSQQFLTLLGFEASATTIRHYHGALVPGLLQTEGYARAVLTAYSSETANIEDLVTARMERQALLERDDPPELVYILDEAAIRRWVGGKAVMRDQLISLKEFVARPNISIQIIPLSEGAHAGMRGPFAIYEFPPDQDEDYVVFLENIAGSTLIRNDNGEASTYLDTFLELEKLATPKVEINDLLDEVIAQFDSSAGGIGRDKPQGAET